MLRRTPSYSSHKIFIPVMLLVSILLSSCNLQEFIYPNAVEQPANPAVPNLPQTEVEFSVLVPETTPGDAEILVDILDEVTGLSFNPKRYTLSKVTDRLYSGRVPLSVGSIAKYRYLLKSTPPVSELTPLGVKVRYRLAQIQPESQVRDMVSQWENQPVEVSAGRIQGVVYDSVSQAPASNVMVSIAGISTITSSDGSYTLDGVPVGTYNLVAYSLDGSYKTFQQEAMIAADSTTPATLQLEPTRLVKVTFIVTPPQLSTASTHPIRLLGNLLQLGNTFADLQGGVSALAVRAPQLTTRSDGMYILEIQLPAGIYISYKYSLGDGFWNAEHGLLGEFRIRELIVPEEDSTYYESIDSWEASGAKPVHFYLKVPQNTPVSEHVSIQLNPFGWMEPLTAWPMGDNKWEYTLYSPMNLVGEVSFRICRNEQCDYALDLAAVTSTDANNVFTPSLIEQDIYYEVEEWAYFKSPDEPTPVVTTTITKKTEGFITGIELTRFTNPSWMSSYSSTLQNISDLGANWVIISPTWTVINNSPPVIIQKPGTDLLQPDTSSQISEAAGRGFKVAVFPRLNFPNGVSSWWSTSTRDQDWWQTWFDRYSAFILHHASLAEKNGASALILGGIEVIPALPLGKLFDGAESGVPLDAEARWLALLGEVHSRFSGTIGWVVPYPYLFDRTPSFVNQVDWLYLLWTAPVAASDNPVQADMTVEITRLLEQDIKILKEDTGKPVVLGLQIAAANGSAANCISASEGCLQVNWEKTSVYTDPACPIDLLEQVEIYNAFFIAINQISWLDGIVSRGYYPPANLQDCSPSIHGKPAADVLWYWYPRLIGVK